MLQCQPMLLFKIVLKLNKINNLLKLVFKVVLNLILDDTKFRSDPS